MVIIENIDEAVRYIVAPAGTAPKDLGRRTIYEDREVALRLASVPHLAVYAVTVTVQQITRLG